MKALLLDADGVVLEKGEYFSEVYAREYGVDPASVVDFFKGPFVECQSGHSDLKVELQPYLKKWGWDKDADAFLEYWFNADFTINETGASTVSKFKEKGVSCYLASNNEQYRAAFVEQQLRKSGYPLDGYYFSAFIKKRKEDPAFFEFILRDLDLGADEVAFLDNEQKNVDSASSVGIHSYLYNERIMDELLLNCK